MMYEKPSKNFLMTQSEMAHNQAEMRHELYKAEADRAMMESAEAQRVVSEQNSKVYDYISEQRNRPMARAKFLEAAKTGFVTAALFKIVKESMNSPLSPMDEATLKGMIAQFVDEQGAGALLTKFKTQNTLLAEMGKVCREAYQSTVDHINEFGVEFDSYDMSGMGEFSKPVAKQPAPMADVLKLDTATVDKFYTDMDNVDSKRAAKMIKDKVKDSINNFLDNNLETRIRCEEIMNDAKEKISVAKAANGIPDTPAPAAAPETPASEEQPKQVEEPSTPAEPTEAGAEDKAPSENVSADTQNTPSEEKKKPEEADNGAPEANKTEPTEKPAEMNKPKPQDNDKKEPTQESARVEDIKRQAHRMIHEVQYNRPKNVFHYMVEAITKQALSDDALKAKFVNESKVDMPGIIHTAEIVYTMLEAFNTLEVVDEAYIINYLKSLVD